VSEAVLVLGATMRLTRLVVADDLGLWLIRYPAYRWSNERDPRAETWRAKLVSGLDCPFCVGFWIGAGVLAASRFRLARPVFAALALNEIAAHLGSRLGDVRADE